MTTHDLDLIRRVPARHPVTFEVTKHAKRLWLREVETGSLVYTPPEFIRHRMQSREPMRDLAKAMTDKLRYCISAICVFEARFNPRRGEE